MERAEEVQLIAEVQAGCANAQERLLRAHAGLVGLVIRRYLHTAGSLEYGDLEVLGKLGLLRAAAKFDPERGTRFTTYAYHWISQAIRRGIDTEASIIRIPVCAQKKWERPEVLSLDYPCSVDGRDIGFVGDLLPSEEDLENDAVDRLTACLLPPDVEAAVAALQDHHRAVLRLRFGLSGCQPHSLDEASYVLGISREWVRGLEAAALRSLRNHLGVPEPERVAHKPPSNAGRLTADERALICQLSAQGLTGPQIAKRLGRPVRTINQCVAQGRLEIE